LNIPAQGMLNLHPSLLPRHRGATPLQSVILADDKITGTTLMLMDEELDHGPILAQSKYELRTDETYETLHERMALASRDILADNLSKYLVGEIKPQIQDHSAATYTKLLSKEDGLINWQAPACEIQRQIRAYNPWPGTYTETIDGRILKIFKARIRDDMQLAPGQVQTDNKQIIIGAGQQALEILELQMAGGKRLGAREFLMGARERLEVRS
jgi:methionyl-tRNA formyltransferase